MIPAILAAISALTLAFVLYPLVRRGPAGGLPAGDPEQERLLEQRASAYEAMTELDFDRQLGKLDEADYRSLYERYRGQAVAALKATREREAALTTRIERRVQEARRTLAAQPAGATAVPPVARPSPRSRLAHSVERRPAAWLSALGVLFLVFASATVWVWTQGSRATASAAPIGTVPGTDHAALLIDNGRGAWALSGDATGIRRSADGGATWSAIPVLPGEVAGLAQDAGGGRAYALMDGRLQRSSDGGTTWAPGGTMPRGTRLATLTADPESPGTLYALDRAGALFRSANGGDSWERLEFRLAGPAQALTVASPAPLQLFAAAEGFGVIGGEDGAWASANGVINGALPTDVVHSVVYDRSTGATSTGPNGERTQGTLYAATDRGVFRSTDHGQDWFRLGLDGDIRTVAVGPPGSQLMLAVSATGEVYRSTDRGVTWTGR